VQIAATGGTNPCRELLSRASPGCTVVFIAVFAVLVLDATPASAQSTHGSEAARSANRGRQVDSATVGQVKDPGARALFQRHCERCHDDDGRGEGSRDSMKEIPDFTNAAWQARRDGAQLLSSLLNGKRRGMPQFRSKLTDDEARRLISFIRSFAPQTARAAEPKPSSESEFRRRFRVLQDEMRQLDEQYAEIVAGSKRKRPRRRRAR
jgi:cytochrome c553